MVDLRGERLTVVMYHFVRDLTNSSFPGIKGLSIEHFVGQLEYIQRYYNVIGWTELADALSSPGAYLPPRALLLTFDDGYRDHYENVLPQLVDRGLTGCFYPPAKAITMQEVLDVNKIHFILASAPDKAEIVSSLFALVGDARAEFGLPSEAWYRRKLAHPNRFDTAEVILIKRMLQRELPGDLRKHIVDALFRRCVTSDESGFAKELYVGVEELRAMREAGMHVGSHGYDHLWLDSLASSEQEHEVDLSLRFLQSLGVLGDDWTICYPYGAYNGALLTIVREKGCQAGFTTEVRSAKLGEDNRLTLPRLDTNDLPKRGDASPDDWTLEILKEDAAT